MERRDIMKALLSQVEISYMTARDEGVENLTVYKELFAKLSNLSNRNVDYKEVVKRGLKFAPFGNIRGKKKEDAVITMASNFLKSKWTTPEGRKEIAIKAEKTTRKRYGISSAVYKSSIDYINRLNAVDVFENEVVPDMESKWIPPSELVFEAYEMAKGMGISDNYAEEALQYVKENARSLEDMDALRDSLYEYYDNLFDD